ncbi:MAG: hypothetical protein EOO77_44790, partial [Oxalobacteraceae bacterium]
CMKELEVRRRDAISKAFFDGFTYTEVAAQAGVPVGTVKSWIRRGLRARPKIELSDFSSL